ncbi:MAG: SRPBCC domain-containing protein [FCB group bacterium]|jgi:uncharacterized protein YndB with AHSA1/START domain|nr:SRPBCC domain-containing protein [FCB group bacterium]
MTGNHSSSEAAAFSFEPQLDEAAFVITYVFDTPRRRVFNAWTQANRLKRWWGPKGFRMGVCNVDLRPGGAFHYSMRSPEGRDLWGKFIFQEVVAPERLTFLNCFSNRTGAPVRHPLSPTWPLEVLTTLTFVEQEGKTTLTLRSVPHAATEPECQTFRDGHDSMRAGLAAALEKLARYLAKA